MVSTSRPKTTGVTPFHYADANDLRSWCRALGHPNLDREIEFEGDAHNAPHQIQTLFTLLEKTNG